MEKKHAYRITHRGPSHWAAETPGGPRIRYNADERLGKNIIHLTGSEAASGRYNHLGLVALSAMTTAEIVEHAVKESEAQAPKVEDEKVKKLTVNPDQKEAALSAPPKIEIPKNWRDLPKARRAAIVRRISGQNAVSWGDEELNAAIQGYIDGNTDSSAS